MQHYEAGILKTRRPDAHQIWDGDEIGMNPHGHKGKQCFTAFFRRMIVRVVGGEGGKAPFWVTFFFWTRADGQFPVPPCVVHQAAKWSKFLSLNLPGDWCVHHSPSGYMDRDGWFKVAVHFQKFCGPIRPQYLYFDAHDSHWDSDSLKLWYDDMIYSTFLKAHGSNDDNFNDNGPNAKCHAIYDYHTTEWERAHPGVPDSPAFVNQRRRDMWDEMKADGGRVAVNAARKTGLYPFNPQSENHTDGTELVSRKFALHEPVRDGAAEYSPEWRENKEGPKYTVIQVRATCDWLCCDPCPHAGQTKCTKQEPTNQI